MPAHDIAFDETRDAVTWVRCAKAGNFEAAWATSDRMLARHSARPCPLLPRHLQTVWTGTPLHGQRVLIRCYHGLGDTVQFIRYAPLVKNIAREVIVWAQPRLLPVLRTASGIDRLLPLHDGVPEVEYDVDLEVMELPFVFRSTLSTIPADVPYLNVSAAPVDDSVGWRVGIAWRAGPWDPRRSIPFDLLDALLNIRGVRWYQLQYEGTRHERHQNLSILGSNTVLETARDMRGLDLVVSIDSLPAHLAGALGVPVWTLLPYRADWRWMERRTDSPWYPTMRLFRQPVEHDWAAVISDVQRTLTRSARGWSAGRAGHHA